jgi:high-affinity nickel-transport protein
MVGLTGRIAAIYALLIGANIAAWAWALTAFQDHPVLIGTAVLAYSFGLRHAVDADHIAAIDNVTRKLMQEGQRPIGVGLFFSLGHSTIVVVLCSPSRSAPASPLASGASRTWVG